MKDYVAIADQYIADVLAGRVVAGRLIKLACQRQRDDLARTDWPYTFDHDRANHVCRFVELLPHVKGQHARNGARIKLEPWQVFILTTAFGWIDGNGNRRFRKAYIEVARKNAKALALDTPIPTPTGWSTMGELQPGDQVIGGDGRPCNVAAVSKVFPHHRCYRLTFSNDDEIVADRGHLWKVQQHAFPVTTEQLTDMPGPLSIATAPPLALPHNINLIDPYGTGKAWAHVGGPIGEAYLRGSLNQRQDLLAGLALHIDEARAESLRDRARALAAERDTSPDPMRQHHAASTLRHTQQAVRDRRHPTLDVLEAADPWMAEQVAELLRTIQAQPSVEAERAPTERPLGYRYPLDAAVADSVDIVGIRQVPSVPTRCITVDSPDHMFLAGRSMILTHNSTTSSGVALYCLTADDEPGARIVSAATTRDQARLTLDDARAMVNATPQMQERFGVAASKHTVYVEATNSNFVSLSRESSTMDGLNPSFVLLDEVHAYKNRDLLDVLTSAQGARAQPWLWEITTAGTNLAGIGREEHVYSRKVLDRVAEDERRFVAIYTLDDDDDWQDPANWPKANPNLGVSVNREHLEQELAKAQAMASAVNGFKTKHLNIWCSANTALFDMQAWMRCEDPSLSLDQFNGKTCIIGLDLAEKKDFTAKVLLFEEAGHYYLFARSYLPSKTVESSGNSQFQGWAHEGWLTVTEGTITDYDVIQADLEHDLTTFDVDDIGYDPYQATALVGRLMKQGAPMTEFRATVQNLSEPTKELEALILAGRIHTNGDPVLRWCMSNVVGHFDAKQNVYPRRESDKSKIDAAIAAIMALAISIQRSAEAEPEYSLHVI